MSREPGLLASFVVALCAAAVLALANVLYGNRPWSDHLGGFLLLGTSLALFGWGGNRLWRTSVGPMVTGGWLAEASRLPFWYFCGAIGYVLGLLAAKKLGLLTVYDIPVKPLFRFGGIVGLATGLALRWLPTLFARWTDDTRRTA